MTTIGTCSLCGGPVTIPSLWHGIIPPTPTCSACGAKKSKPRGPVIPMERPPRRYGDTGTAPWRPPPYYEVTCSAKNPFFR